MNIYLKGDINNTEIYIPMIKVLNRVLIISLKHKSGHGIPD